MTIWAAGGSEGGGQVRLVKRIQRGGKGKGAMVWGEGSGQGPPVSQGVSPEDVL
jgi:hypothetical protein